MNFPEHRVHGLAEKQHLHGQKLPLPTLPPPSLSAVFCETDALFSSQTSSFDHWRSALS